ncbi:hypothetical protein P170DRAFT_50869 [Aspergillus steynii IBT 23096]|uniref:Cupin type-1 domain-containing protein n=1 Tax=Aspergillus steynii IBT 23096 TaxID=1392250 RepID=A0A2I2GSI2_9EURO|nr:uncharacterized protein P170DRAFT_50869 [Aspergillus steynii IBT 23096]PLB55844.1 hypothetical protein P170DRAFT_50869 [Aspergillus steynii IBT 23096]
MAPETYHLSPTLHAPNNSLPVLHYRNVLPRPLSESSATEFLTSHKWEKRGTWGAISTRHFHPNSHECYGIFQGTSTLLLGAAGGDLDPSAGIKVTLHAGDVLVLPAGTAHSSVDGDDNPEYRYVGVYPEGCPRWRNEYGKEPIDLHALRREIDAVAMPLEDPVYGEDGPLCQLWKKSMSASRL